MSTFVNELELSQVDFSPKYRKRKANKLLKQERRTALLFILPPVISFSVFTIIPLFVTLLLAFGDFIVMIIILIFGFLSCIKVILDGIAEIIGRRLKKNGCFIRK